MVEPCVESSCSPHDRNDLGPAPAEANLQQGTVLLREPVRQQSDSDFAEAGRKIRWLKHIYTIDILSM